ncbi:hypothetical protein OA77_19220, partial [Pseudomonas coronafaciens]
LYQAVLRFFYVRGFIVNSIPTQDLSPLPPIAGFLCPQFEHDLFAMRLTGFGIHRIRRLSHVGQIGNIQQKTISKPCPFR